MPSPLEEFTPRTDVDAYFIPVGESDGGRLFDPTIHVQGAWNEAEQHLAATAGLLTHVIEQHEPRDGMHLSKITFDVYGFIPLRPSLVTVRTVRPGRTIELVEAELTIDGRTIVVARAWRLAAQNSSAIAGSDVPPMPALTECPTSDMQTLWPGGYIRSLTKFAAVDPVPGRARAWLQMHLPLVEGESTSATTRFLAVVDGANGIAPRADPREWMFPNVDLTIHLFRTPDPTATGFDTTVSMGERGLGVTSTILHDVHGPVGYAAQSLTVRAVSAPA